jgi:hypothetical protein
VAAADGTTNRRSGAGSLGPGGCACFSVFGWARVQDIKLSLNGPRVGRGQRKGLVARGRGIGSRVVTVGFNSGLFVPVNGPFRACLNGSGSCPLVGLGLGPSTVRCIGPGRPGPK